MKIRYDRTTLNDEFQSGVVCCTSISPLVIMYFRATPHLLRERLILRQSLLLCNVPVCNSLPLIFTTMATGYMPNDHPLFNPIPHKSEANHHHHSILHAMHFYIGLYQLADLEHKPKLYESPLPTSSYIYL